MVEVADTGSGIPPEQLSRIYDPFFTTKEIGKGTGLGLSITYGIVQEHDGTIACESAPGQGTRFSLTLPLASAQRRPAPADPAGVRRPLVTRRRTQAMTRNASILVIDDEEIMREILEALLTREGYAVRLAEHAAPGAGARPQDHLRRRHRRHDDARAWTAFRRSTS